MAHTEILGGGQFLFVDFPLEKVFTPEDFTVEHRLVGKSAEELGFLFLDIPEEYGGVDMDMVSSALVTERIHQGMSAFMLVYVMETGVGTLPFLLFGTPDQKDKY